MSNPTPFPRASYWPDGKPLRTNGTMWPQGPRYGSPWPFHWECIIQGTDGTPPLAFLKPGSLTIFIASQTILTCQFVLLPGPTFVIAYHYLLDDVSNKFWWTQIERSYGGNSRTTQELVWKQWDGVLPQGKTFAASGPMTVTMEEDEDIPAWQIRWLCYPRPDCYEIVA